MIDRYRVQMDVGHLRFEKLQAMDFFTMNADYKTALSVGPDGLGLTSGPTEEDQMRLG